MCKDKNINSYIMLLENKINNLFAMQVIYIKTINNNYYLFIIILLTNTARKMFKYLITIWTKIFVISVLFKSRQMTNIFLEN